MARSIKTLTLLVALLALPAATALPAGSSPSASASDVPVPPVPDVKGLLDLSAVEEAHATVLAAVESAKQAAQPIYDEVGKLLCRKAIAVEFTWYGARITDTMAEGGRFLMPHAWTQKVTRMVPVYETVTEEVGGAVASLFGLVEPVTREVTRLVGYEPREALEELRVDLAVSAEWQASYLQWGTYHETLLLNVLVGLPYLDDGEGRMVSVCDDSPILTYIPDPSAEGVDVWCVACTEQPEDGWAVRILSLDVRLADAEDYAADLPLANDWLIASGDLLARAQRQAASLGLDAADAKAQQAVRDGTPAAPEPAIGPQAGEVVHVPATTAGAYLLIVVVVASMLVLAAVARRKRKAE